MPWKNGRGITTQLLIWPEGADFQKGDFVFRASRATLRENGLFSVFPGFDRLLALWKGKELGLASPQLTQILLPGKVIAFPGEAVMDATLPSGTVQDFNVITRRGQAQSTLEVLDLEGAGRKRPLSAGFCFLVCAEGQVAVDIEAEDYRSSYHLNAEESLLLDDRQRLKAKDPLLSLRGLVPASRVFLVFVDELS